MTTTPLRLTQLTKGAGCGCKIAPAVLSNILSATTNQPLFSNLLVGNESRDDAAVMDLGDGHSLISSVDFFTPVVDDPFEYGRIAAANAISDIYAMGGNPLLAIAILGFPTEKLDSAVATQIIDGAKDICNQAGIPLAGGHTIEAPEPFFGLAVNGMVFRDYIKKNKGAKPGDLLYITKPIGSGIMNTAIKRDLCKPEHYTPHLQNMLHLNKSGALLGQKTYIHAMTDVTGFALLGHLCEMTEFSNVSAELYTREIPVYPFIDEYLAANCIPDNSYRNWNSYEKQVNGLNDMRNFQLLNDPQTNGGLLVAVDPASAKEFTDFLIEQGYQDSTRPIGLITEKKEQLIYIT